MAKCCSTCEPPYLWSLSIAHDFYLVLVRARFYLRCRPANQQLRSTDVILCLCDCIAQHIALSRKKTSSKGHCLMECRQMLPAIVPQFAQYKPNSTVVPPDWNL